MAGQRFNSGRVSDWGRTIDVPPIPLPPRVGFDLPRLNLASANAGGTCSAYQQLRVNYIAVSRPCTLGSVRFNVNGAAATAGTVVRFGVYSVLPDGMIGPLISDLGTIAVDSTGTKTIDFSANPISVSAQGYYMANCWQDQNSTFNFIAYVGGASGGAVGYIYQPAFTGTRSLSNSASNYFVANVTGALPSDPSWGIGDASNIPIHAWNVVSVP